MIQRYQFRMSPRSEVTEDPKGLWCMHSDTEAETRRANSAEAELRETAGELEKAKADRAALVAQGLYYKDRLTEATALLGDVAELALESGYDIWLERYQAFLSRAPAQLAMCRADTGGVPCGEQEPCAEHPAQPATPTPVLQPLALTEDRTDAQLKVDGDWQPAAPEPSAETFPADAPASPFGMYCKLEYAKQWQERAGSAESTLAAAQGKLARANCLLLCAHPIVSRSGDQGLRGAINHHLRQRECGFEDMAGPGPSATPPGPALAERTKEEQAVLDAMGAIRIERLQWLIGEWHQWNERKSTDPDDKRWIDAAQAELARRESKGGGRG